MPAPGVHGATTNAAGAATSLAISTPKRSDGTALQAKDRLWATIFTGGSVTTAAPAGWTKIAAITSDGVLVLNVFTRIVEEVEPTSHTWSFSGSTLCVGGIQAISDAGAHEAFNTFVADTTSTACPTNSVDTLGPDRLILTFHVWSHGSLVNSSTASPPTGMSEKAERNTSSIATIKRLLEMNFVTQAAAGASGSKSATATEAADFRRGFIVAIPSASLEVTNAGGIASAEAFGSATISGDVRDAGGIPSAEAFGVLSTNLSVAPGGIPSAEAFGTPEVLGSGIGPISIPSEEAFGTPSVARDVKEAGGIASAEAFGTPVAGRTAHPGGIPSAEAFESPTVAPGLAVIGDAGEIPSGEAFGGAAVDPGPVVVSPDSIPSAESFGTPVVTVRVTEAGGIPSGEAFGTPVAGRAMHPSGIPSAEAFGTPGVSHLISVPSIPSAEAFGGLKTVDRVVPINASIPSEEAFDRPSVVGGERKEATLLLARPVVRLLAPYIHGQFGPMHLATEVYVSNIAGENLGRLNGVMGVGIDMSNARDATWKVSLKMRANKDFNVFGDWVKVVTTIELVDGTVKKYDYGLYKFFAPEGDKGLTGTIWSLEGYSGEALFQDDTSRGVYVVPKGSMILARVRDLLLERGVPASRINLPMHLDKPTRSDQVFDPFNDESKATRIRVINALLNSAGFHAIYCTREGNWITKKYEDARDRKADVFYGPNWPHEEPILTGRVTDNWDTERFANAIVVTEESPPEAGQEFIYEVAENNDPNSAGSYDNIGYWKVKQVKMATIASREDAKRMAKAQLQAASGIYRRASWSTPPDYDRREKEHAHFNVRDEDHSILGEFKIDNFSFDAYPHPKVYSFSGSKIEPI